MSNPGFTTLNEDYLEVQLSSKNLSNQTLLLRIGQLEEYLERVGEPKKFKIDLDFRDNPKVTDTDLEFDGFGRLVAFLKKFGTFVTRLRIGGTGISGSGLCELIDFIKMGAAEELDFSNLPGVEQDEVVALLMAVKESGQYPLQKSLPLLFRLDRNGLEKPHEIIALVSQDLCCEVLTDPCELQKATVARNKVHRGEAEPTEVMISLPEFYLQSEEAVVTTPVPQTPKSAPSTPEKSEKKPLNLRAKAPPPPAPPAPCAEQMEDVKVEEEDLPVVGSLPKAFCGSRAKKASPVGVSILPLANPKPPDHIPPAHVMWKNLSTSAKARKWMEVEIQKSVMTKASSRCDSTALAQGVPETVPIYGMGVPPPNERPKPTKATALASPMPPPLSPPSPPSPPPPWSPWSRESSTVAIPAKPRPPQRSEETSFTPGIPSAKSQVVQVLTQVAAGGKAISQAAQSDALRMLEKFTKSDAVPKPTSSEVRKMPSPQQKQVASGSQEWNHSEGKEEWKDWSERKWGDWSGAPWRREWSDQAWSEWDNKKETTWDAKKETTWDFKKESAWGVKQESTWDVKQESAWGVKQESTWDVKQESAWDDKETTWEPKKETPYPETAWDVKKEGTWDVKKETTWDVKKETTWNVKQEITWDVKQEWSWTGQFEKDENSQAQSWKHTEVKAEEWNDWSDWKTAGHWEKPVTSTTSTTWPEEKEWTRRWSEKASEEQDSEWKERKSQPPEGRAEEKPSVEKASTEVEGALADVDDGDDDEPSERIGRYAMILERWKEKKEQYQQDLKKSRASRAELKQELSLQQDACRDNSEDPSEPETEAFEAFPRVPAPSAAYEAYDSIYEDVEEELEEAEADPMDPMDVDEVAKRSREILRKARGQVPQRPGKRGRSPLPQEPPYPPPKKGRTGGRRSSLRGPPRRKKKGGLDDSKAVAVDIRNLLYSQKSCKDTFQCGRSVDQLVKDLETGKVDLSAPFLRLTVFETREEKSRKPELRCIDNRRLLALKEYAKKIGNPKLKVNISLFSEETLTQVQRFFQNSDDTDGRDVRLRTSRNDKRRQLVD